MNRYFSRWLGESDQVEANSFENVGESGGVAYGAHIGGFVAGVVFDLLARALLKEESPTVFREQYARDPSVRRYW